MDFETLKKLGEGSPYFGHLHMELLEAEEGYAKVCMDIRPCHINVMGIVHGGAVASLADQAGMRAVQTMLVQGQIGSTVQMDMHYLAPARGCRLVAVGRVQKMGRLVAFSDVEVRDETGKAVALGRCTIAIIDDGEDRVDK
jgi:acyl-CoA thioesterase